jgi:hypothetical protein
LNYRKELLAIKEHEAAKQEAAQEAAEKIYVSEKGNNKGFDFSKFDITKLPDELKPENIEKYVRALTDAAEKVFQEADKKTRENEKDKYGKLAEEFGNYEQKKKAIAEKWEKEIAKLPVDLQTGAQEKRDNELSELDADFVQKNSLWKRLVLDTEKLTVDQARVISRQLREMVLSIADEEVRDRLVRTLDDIDKRVEKSVDELKNVFGDNEMGAVVNLFVGGDNFETKIDKMVAGFKNVDKDSKSASDNMNSAASSANKASGKFASTFAVVDAIVTGIHNIAQELKQTVDYFREYEELVNGHASNSRFQQNMEGYAKFDSMVYSGFEKLKSGNVMGAITDNIQAWHYFFQKDTILEAEFLRQKNEEYTIDKEINVLLREKYDWTQKIGEAALMYLSRQGEELKRQKEANAQDQDDLLAKLYATEYKESERLVKREFLGVDWLDKDTVETTWSSLAGSSWEEIVRIAESGKLSDEGMRYYEALKSAREEGDALADRQEKYAETVRETLAGSTYDGVVNGIVDAFRDGKRSAEDFAETFNDLMADALTSALKMMTDEKMRNWYESFAEMGEGGFTDEEIVLAKKSFMSSIEAIGADAELLKKIADFSQSQAQQDATKGLFETLSQETGSALLSQFTAFRIHVSDISGLLSEMDFQSTAFVNHLAAIEKNTADTVTELRTANKYFKAVVTEGVKIL